MALSGDHHLGDSSHTDIDLADLAVLATELADLAERSIDSRGDHADLLVGAVGVHDQLQRVIGSLADTADHIAAAPTRGEKSVTALLRGCGHTRTSQTKQFLTLGRVRHRFLNFTAAHRSRQITTGHVETITDLANRVDRQQLAAAEPFLCAAAMVSTVEEFAAACREWEAAADPEAHLDDYITAQARQHLVFGNDLFGNLHLDGTLAPLQGEAFYNRILTEADALDPTNTRSRNFAEALCRIVLGNTTPEVTVHVMCNCNHHCTCTNNNADGAPAGNRSVHDAGGDDAGNSSDSAPAVESDDNQDTTEPPDTESAPGWHNPSGYLDYPQTLGGRLIPPALIQQLINNDSGRIQHHRIGLDGIIIDTTVGGRHFTRRQKQLIDLQHRRCQHHGCTTPARYCHKDHIQPYYRGGPTTVANGQNLCAFHHKWKHRNDPGQPDP